jgi:protocatechuate 3,4-dioxygenase, alpha subunit
MSPHDLFETASQTGGPYVHIGLAPAQAGFAIYESNFGHVLVDAKTQGERIVVEGLVIDGSGTPMRDVLIECWQADAHGQQLSRLWPQRGGFFFGPVPL